MRSDREGDLYGKSSTCDLFLNILMWLSLFVDLFRFLSAGFNVLTGRTVERVLL
jgi:hypothetical protein